MTPGPSPAPARTIFAEVYTDQELTRPLQQGSYTRLYINIENVDPDPERWAYRFGEDSSDEFQKLEVITEDGIEINLFDSFTYHGGGTLEPGVFPLESATEVSIPPIAKGIYYLDELD